MPIRHVLAENGLRKPVKIWSNLKDPAWDKTTTQLRNTASMPFIFKHVAAMPDVHFGLGSTVGSVIATKRAIMPAAVGVDIGCGMMAVETDLPLMQVQDKVKEIRKQIERSVPVGANQNKKITAWVQDWSGWAPTNPLSNKITDLFEKAQHQMGTLGGGNHFIEICQDTDGRVWVMLHSGSRGIGNKVAMRHINDAKKLMELWMIHTADKDLAYFPEGSDYFNDYMKDLNWLQEYAFENRREMMRRVLDQLKRLFRPDTDTPLTRLQEINCHHNYTTKENHFGENVWITRKGAIRAREGDLGIIPGSMGTKSYIVEGLGNPDSFNSASHGAGRCMSRGDARRKFTVADLEAQTQGVECPKDKARIDEIPSSYKDIDEVMANQTDLVKVRYELKQIVCVKG